MPKKDSSDGFNYGMNTNVMMSPKGKQIVEKSVADSNEINECTRQLQGCTFTRNQYEQILQMLKRLQVHESMTNGAGKANSANAPGKALLVSENNEVWIIDTGAIR